MSLVEVKVPVLSESVAEATLGSWHKKEGDFVQRDENLIDIETDKVILETPAPEAGVLVSIKSTSGATVTSQEVIAVIDTSKKAETSAPAETKAAPAASANSADTKAAASVSTDASSALPAARKLLAENNINASDVEGSGRGGRVTKGDVIEHVSGGGAKPKTATAAPVIAPVAAGERIEQRVPMSRLRQRVAERLVQSQSTAAILSTFNEVNMKPVMDLRARYKDSFEKAHGVKLGFMSFFVKAVVAALKKFPIVNASIDGTDIVYHGYYDIGVAVGSPRGLVVPIIRDADQLSMAQIEKTIVEFGKRAQDGKLTVEELSGGTFTISNGGTFGSMLSTPIINPPQSGILGVHATKDRPVAENGQVVIRPMNYLALSYDHRIIDGREGVLFLVAIKEALEDPSRLLLDL
ncbi:MAG: 2-oxoglutarate dehydrogenase complex dihydrolipoyllysine-residue succinyltransferase [Pseudomonadota bacterium]